MTFLDRLQVSFAQLAAVIPALFGALVILFAGYLLARLVQRGAERLFRRMQLNAILERGGVLQAVERSGTHPNPTRIVANLAFWFVMFSVLLLAANAMGLESLAEVFSQLVGFIPSVIASIVIVIVGIVLGEFVGGIIMASAGALEGGPTLARVGRGGVIVIAIFMALQQLGVAMDIVTIAFAILFGAVALALALSFGLGNRELAGEVTRRWYERYRAEREAIAREAAAQEAMDAAEDAAAAERAAAAAREARARREIERAQREQRRRARGGDQPENGTVENTGSVGGEKPGPAAPLADVVIPNADRGVES